MISIYKKFHVHFHFNSLIVILKLQIVGILVQDPALSKERDKLNIKIATKITMKKEAIDMITIAIDINSISNPNKNAI